ncbi:MAG: hypothetical protein ACRDTQ_19815 [Micromonosporaceae bacterium]
MRLVIPLRRTSWVRWVRPVSLVRLVSRVRRLACPAFSCGPQELVRLGMGTDDMAVVAGHIADLLLRRTG